MWNSESFYEKLLDGWERSETTEGIPYYINHNTERTQWDHPLLVKTMEELGDMDSIRYAAYRTAMKLRFIQKRLRLDLVELATVEGVFERHGFPASKDTFIDAPGLYSILVDIFVLTRNTEVTRNINKEQAAELVLNWMLNLYDVNRSGCIRVLSVKIGLAAICCARLLEKYKYMFKQLRDHTNHITRKKMTVFLHDLMQITDQIKESDPFGGMNVAPAVESCFQQSWDTTGVAEDAYITWLMMEPQTVVWLPTIHRMAAAESVKHEAKCNICKNFPIIGFRYKCLKCFNFDMCQQCFFTGRVSKKHKLKHPTQEYCVVTTSRDDTKAFMKTIRNNLSRKHRNKVKLRYLPIYGADTVDDKERIYNNFGSPDTHSSMHKIADRLAEVEDRSPGSVEQLPNFKKSANSLNRSPEHPSPRQYYTDDDEHIFEKSGIYLAGPDRKEMESIMLHLERENRELLNEIDSMQHRQLDRYDNDSEASEREWLKDEKERLQVKQEILESHNKQLEYQLQRLRHLIGQDGGARSPLGPVDGNIPDERHETQHKKIPQEDFENTMTPDAQLPKPQNYTPHHPQSPPAYTTDNLQDQSNQSFFSNSLLMPVPQSAAYKRREISPIRSDSQNSIMERRKDSNARKSLNSLEGLSQLEIDITYGSMDPALGQTHFSLPDINHSVDYDDEEAEMDELLGKLDHALPGDTSNSMLLHNKTTMTNMYRAAHGIGDVMVDIASPGPAYMTADISDILAEATGNTSGAHYVEEEESTLDDVEGALGFSNA